MSSLNQNQTSTATVLPNSDTEQRSRSELGFTLIETAIALVVMMVVSLGVMALFTFATNYTSDANDRALALSLAQQRMERLRTTSFTDASLAIGSTTEDVSSGNRPYRIVSTIGGSATLRTITISVTPLGATKQWAGAPIIVVGQRAIPAPGPYLR